MTGRLRRAPPDGWVRVGMPGHAVIRADVALANLRQLLEECRVLAKGMTRGAGFFVAPRWVVTCSHVAGDAVDSQISIEWGPHSMIGYVRAASPAPTNREIWPYPDLALIEVPDAPDQHPCVWLDVAPSYQGTPLTAAGFSDIYQPKTMAERSAAFTVGGSTGIPGGRALELLGNEINSGLSGGPVLNEYSGGVCAVVKAQRLPESELGGVAVRVQAMRALDPAVYQVVMRAHDRFHHDDDRWTRLSDRVAAAAHGDEPARSLLAAERRRLLALFARLPAAGDAHRGAFADAADTGARPSPGLPLIDHRDVFSELAAQMPPDEGSLPYELRFAADLATRPADRDDAEAIRQEVRDQVLIKAGRMGLGDQMRARLRRTGENSFRPVIVARLQHAGHEHQPPRTQTASLPSDGWRQGSRCAPVGSFWALPRSYLGRHVRQGGARALPAPSAR